MQIGRLFLASEHVDALCDIYELLPLAWAAPVGAQGIFQALEEDIPPPFAFLAALSSFLSAAAVSSLCFA